MSDPELPQDPDARYQSPALSAPESEAALDTPAEAENALESATLAAETLPAAPAPSMAPVSLSERFEFLDVLRGCALFGILTANMRGFFESENLYFGWRKFYTWTPDVVAQNLIDFFVQGKFVTLFAMMFGLGFAIQMTRTEARGSKPWFYLRRLAALLMFGMIHGFLIWWGDILAAYAMAGFLIFWFRKAKLKTTLIWAASIWCLPLVGMAIGLIVQDFRGGPDRPREPQQQQQQQAQKNPQKSWRDERAEQVKIFQQGTFSEIMRKKLQLARNTMLPPQNIGEVIFAFSLFLLGLAIWRAGILQNLPEHHGVLLRTFRIALPIGLFCMAINFAWGQFAPATLREKFTFSAAVVQWSSIYGNNFLAAAYASGLALLWLKSEVWRGRLRPFGAVGRTALTNYLMQSILCTTLFYSYGAKLFGKIGPAWGIVPTVVLYGAQLAFSNWWLTRFRYGPFEYLWRILTYGKIPPMRVEREASPVAAAAETA